MSIFELSVCIDWESLFLLGRKIKFCYVDIEKKKKKKLEFNGRKLLVDR